MTDETLHFSDDEREVFRLRAAADDLRKRVVELERELLDAGYSLGAARDQGRADYNALADALVWAREFTPTEAKPSMAVAEIIKERDDYRLAAGKNRDACIRLESKVATLEECVRLANQSTLETAEYVTGLVRDEREACARLVEETHWHPGGVEGSVSPKKIAAAIRARGK